MIEDRTLFETTGRVVSIHLVENIPAVVDVFLADGRRQTIHVETDRPEVFHVGQFVTIVMTGGVPA